MEVNSTSSLDKKMIILAFICGFPRIIGQVPIPIITRAEVVCREQYHGCAVSIMETGDLAYYVKCRRIK